MKKTGSFSMLLTAVSALCLLAAFLLSKATPNPNEQPAPQDLQITDVHVGDAAGLVIRRADEKQGILHVNGSFSVLDHESIAFDESRLSALLFAACHLQAGRVIATPDDLAVYGLAEPECQVSILLANSEYVRFSIGRANPVSGQRYVLSEDERVFLIDGETASLFFQKTDDLRKMSLFGDWTPDVLAKPSQIAVLNAHGAYVLSLIEDSVSGMYAMISPVTAALDWQTVDTRVLQTLPLLIPETFVAEQADLADYGLDTPDLTLALTVGGATRIALFSQASGELWYACAAGSNDVYALPDSLLTGLTAGYTDLLGSSLYHRSLGEIESVTLSTDRSARQFAFLRKPDQILCETDGQVLDAAATSSLYKQLSQIPIAGVLDRSADLSAQPVVRLTFRLRSGALDIIEFIPFEARYCAVSINGEIQMATYKTIADHLLSLL